jgi:hypothetical protein
VAKKKTKMCSSRTAPICQNRPVVSKEAVASSFLSYDFGLGQNELFECDIQFLLSTHHYHELNMYDSAALPIVKTPVSLRGMRNTEVD